MSPTVLPAKAPISDSIAQLYFGDPERPEVQIGWVSVLILFAVMRWSIDYQMLGIADKEREQETGN